MPANVTHMLIAHKALQKLKTKGIDEFAEFAGVLDDTSLTVGEFSNFIPHRAENGRQDFIGHAVIVDVPQLTMFKMTVHLDDRFGPRAAVRSRVAIPSGTLFVPRAGDDVHQPVSIGVIPVDAIFCPVRKVNYRVEDTRVGQRTDYDRLVMEIWTKGGARATSEDRRGVLARQVVSAEHVLSIHRRNLESLGDWIVRRKT